MVYEMGGGDPLGMIRFVKGERDGSKFDSEPYFEIGQQFPVDNDLGLWTDGKWLYFSEKEAEKYQMEFCVEVREPNFVHMKQARPADGAFEKGMIEVPFTKLGKDAQVFGKENSTFIRSASRQ